MKISALIPVFNEQKTIANIINTLLKVKEIDEIVIVDDGSTDNTSDIVRELPVRLIQNVNNRGKGAALQNGIENIETDVLLLMDGDLLGLTTEHIHKLLEPVVTKKADMAVGIFNEGRGITDLAQTVTPNLSGQRAINFSVLQDMENLENSGFGVELTLHRHVKKKGKLVFVELKELTHVMKEEKMGLKKGVIARIKMYWEIFMTLFKKKSS